MSKITSLSDRIFINLTNTFAPKIDTKELYKFKDRVENGAANSCWDVLTELK